MRHRVQIQQRSGAIDDAGQLVEDWATVATVWAAIEPLSGGEGFASAQRNARLTVRFRTRYVEELSAEKRIVWDDKTFDVKAVSVPRGIKSQMVAVADELVGEAP